MLVPKTVFWFPGMCDFWEILGTSNRRVVACDKAVLGFGFCGSLYYTGNHKTRILLSRAPGHAGPRPWRQWQLPTGAPRDDSATGRHPTSARACRGCWRLVFDAILVVQVPHTLSTLLHVQCAKTWRRPRWQAGPLSFFLLLPERKELLE